MKRPVKFQEGGNVQEPMTAAERRRQNMQRLNQRRATNREQAATRAEIERFNERLRTGTLTADDMRRMGGQSDVERFNERMRQGNLTAEEMRRVGGTPSMRDAVRPAMPGEAPRRPADAMRDAVRPVGPSTGRPTPRGPGIAGAAGTLLTLGPAAMEAYNAYRNRPITGNFEQGMEPEGSMEAANAERERQASQPAPVPRPAPRPAARPAPRRPAQREMTPEERHAFMVRTMQEEADREAAARQPERGFFERLGLRRTNETGMEPGTIEHRRNYLGAGATDTNPSMNKKGGMIKAYREGGSIRQGIQSPRAQEARAEMAEDVMRRERAREPISDKDRKAGRMEERMMPGVSEDFLRMRERERAGFKKGGAIKPKGHGMKEEAMEMKGGRYRGGMKEEMAEMKSGKKGAMPMMKKGGKVKAPAKKMKAGGKVAPKKMMHGGMTSKPKKMMGGGKVKYAKGGMTRGCK